MTWATIGAAAATAVISSSGKQTAGTPPPPAQFGGGGGFQMPGQDENMRRIMQQPAPQPNNLMPVQQPNRNVTPVSDAINSMPQGQMGPPQPAQQMGPQQPQGQPGGGFGSMMSGFGQGLDSTLSSPSKMMGIGALGEVDPRLAMAGLMAGGIFGARNGGR